MQHKLIAAVIGLSALAIPGVAFAAAPAILGNPALDALLATIIYSAVGMFMAFVAYKVTDLITPGNLSKDIAENNCVALAILAGSIVLGVSIIIAASIAS